VPAAAVGHPSPPTANQRGRPRAGAIGTRHRPEEPASDRLTGDAYRISPVINFWYQILPARNGAFMMPPWTAAGSGS